METLLRYAPSPLEAFVACPREAPYWGRFGALVGEDRLFEIPHRRFSLGRAAALVRFARWAGVDVLHSHGKGAGLYARFVAARTGLPCLHTPHGVHIGQYGALRRRLYVGYENLTCRWVSRVLYVSDSERQAADRAGLWRGADDRVIPNGVPFVEDNVIESWRRQWREKYGWRDGQFVVATVTRFDVQKNMAVALEIAALLPGITFLWIGDGPERTSLLATARRRGIRNIHSVGTVEDPRPLLAAADAYLSTSRWEGLPLAVLEAMSVGLPCVLSAVVGHIGLLVGDREGLFYPLSDAAAAAGRLQELNTRPQWAAGIAAAGRRRQAEDYEAIRCAGAIVDAYRQSAGRSGERDKL